MSLTFKIAGTTVPTEAVTLGESVIPGGIVGLPMSAWYGEPSSASIIIDDPGGLYEDILSQPWVTFTADEDECSKPRIFAGWLNARSISRGGYRTGPGRIWECTIVDINALWSFEVFRAQSAQRPAETDIVRADFCRNSAPMASTPVQDNGRWNVTDNPVNFGDANYVAQFPAGLMESIAGISGKNFYAYWDHDAEEISGFYDLVTGMPEAEMKVSNVLSEYDPFPGIGDPAVFLPLLDGTMDLDPNEYYSGELLNYRGAYAYGRRQETIDATLPSAFSPDGLMRDLSRSTDRIGLLATAQAIIASDLERMANEEATITVTVRVPNTHVNLCEAGYALPLHLTHIPGFQDDFVNIPIIRRNVTLTPGRLDMYDIYLELNAGTKLSSVPGGGPPGVFIPPRPVCDPDDLALVASSPHTDDIGGTGNTTLPVTPTPNNLQVVFTGMNDPFPANDITPDSFTDITGPIDVAPAHQDFQAQAWYRIAQTGDTTTLHSSVSGSDPKRLGYVEFEGVDTLHSYDIEEFQTSGNVTGSVTLGTVTPPSGEPCLLVFGMVPALNINDGFSAVKDHADDVEDIDYGVVAGQGPYMWLGHRIVTSASGSYSPSITVSHGGAMRGYGTFVAVFTCSGDDPEFACALTGIWTDWIYLQDGDGTTTDFTIPCPYADGGLRVKVDGLEIIAGLTMDDPAAGDFSLDFAPKAAIGDSRAEKVYYKYQGR